MHRDAGSERELTHAFTRCSVHEQGLIGSGGHFQARVAQRAGQVLRVGATDTDRAAGACGQVRQRRLDNKMSAADDQHLVNGLCDLGQHVARDQHRAALRCQPAQEVTQPANPLRVKAVGRLVKDQELGSPSSAAASPSRWRIPSEYPLTRRRDASANSTSFRTSSARVSGTSTARASIRR